MLFGVFFFSFRNFLFIGMPSYTCQVVLLFQAFLNENLANYLLRSFSQETVAESLDQAAFACVAGVELILGLNSSHWHLVL